MDIHIRTLLTIITESSLESGLSKELEMLGANGYTITDARGKGDRGERVAEWDAEKNIRIEVVISGDIALKITDYLQEKYYKNFAMIVYSHEVKVLRPNKF